MLEFTQKEKTLLKKLNTPAKVQDYLNSLEFNFEEDGKDVIKSPIRVMREKKAHCMEGAVLAAYILSLHKNKPMILHLQTEKGDYDHVIALFKQNGLWGAISKTNHAVLRYREPVYKTVRELVMSYFHEYFLNSNGKKTLRRYSSLLELSKNKFCKNWEVSEEDLWEIDEELDKIKHFDIAPKSVFKNLRKADKIETEAGKIEEYKKSKKFKK
jgi:hypothetical protein